MFGGDAGGNIVAFNATTGKPVWHSHIGNVTNPPITYMLDGRQHLLVAANNVLYASCSTIRRRRRWRGRGAVVFRLRGFRLSAGRLRCRESYGSLHASFQLKLEATRLLVLMQGVPQIGTRGAGRRQQAGDERDQSEDQCGDAE